MFKMTKGDLAKKSDAQLAALFQQASVGLTATKASDLTEVHLLIAMIRAERAQRPRTP